MNYLASKVQFGTCLGSLTCVYIMVGKEVKIMALIVWLVVGIAAALIINLLKGHDTVLNTSAAIIGALGVGGGYALWAKDAADSIYSTLTTLSWANFWAAVVGAVAFVIVSQLFTLEMHEYSNAHL